MARLQTAVLCNAASVEQSGLVSMLGAFIDTVRGPRLPLRHQLWLVVRLLFEAGDIGRDHNIEVVVEPVALEESSGTIPQPLPLVRVVGVVHPEPTPSLDPRILGGGPIVVPLPIEFPHLGLYEARFSLNGDLLWAAPLLAKLSGQGE